MDGDQARALLLGLDGVSERDHHGIASFRVPARIVATMPDGGTLRLMLDEADVREAVASWPACCSEVWWGRSLAAVAVRLADADPAVVEELVELAWRQRTARPRRSLT